MVIWITSVGLIPVYLFRSMAWYDWFNWKCFNGTCGRRWASSPTSTWILMPWSWPLRLMCPIVKVHPNGVALQNGDLLMNTSVISICLPLLVGLISGLIDMQEENAENFSLILSSTISRTTIYLSKLFLLLYS